MISMIGYPTTPVSTVAHAARTKKRFIACAVVKYACFHCDQK